MDPTPRSRTATCFLIASITFVIMSMGCSSVDGPVDGASPLDPTLVTLQTPIMYCPLNESYMIPESRDTFTLTGKGFADIQPFKIRLRRIDGTSDESLIPFSNDSSKTSFWFNDKMISTMRWIPKGKYRVEIIDARTHRLVRRVLPELEVRSLQLRPMERTSFESGDQIYMATVFPWASDLPYKAADYLKKYITVWLGDRQLLINTKIDMSDPYPQYTTYYGLSVAASISGSGQIKVRDSFLNEETLGPNITIADVPYTRYFAYGEVTWDKVMTWTDTATTHYYGTLVSGRDSTFTQRDTFRVRLQRGCCDTVTRGDTTRFTNDRNPNGFMQATIIIDADRSICRWISMESVYKTSYSSRLESSSGVTTRTIILRDVPATVLADGSWSIDLDRTSFERHRVNVTFSQWHESSDILGKSSAFQRIGTLTDSDPMRFRLLLSAR